MITVAVDAGHGGHDTGATSAFAGREKDYALLQAHLVRSILSTRRRPGFDVLLTREDDVFLGLRDRAEISNAAGVAAFVSLHWNSGPLSASGTLVLAHRESARGASLAREVLRAVSPLDGQETRSERVVLLPDETFRTMPDGSPFVPTVISRTVAPAVILETGFGTNERDASYLRDPGYMVAVAGAIGDALARWTDAGDTV